MLLIFLGHPYLSLLLELGLHLRTQSSLALEADKVLLGCRVFDFLPFLLLTDCLFWEPSNQLLYSGSSDKAVILWDIGSKKGTAIELQGHS